MTVGMHSAITGKQNRLAIHAAVGWNKRLKVGMQKDYVGIGTHSRLRLHIELVSSLC